MRLSNSDLLLHKKMSKLSLRQYFPTYLMLMPAVLLVLFFMYVPLPGIIMAFLDYDFLLGFKSPWVGMANIIEILTIPEFKTAIGNTLLVSLLNLAIVFPAPLIFALLLNEIRCKFFKRLVQTVSYLPYFLSWMAVVGLATTMFAIYGPVNDVRTMINGEGTERIMFLSQQNLFLLNIIMLNLWKNLGWNSIIYIATITSISPELYEAARIDGAGRLNQCLHITLPGLMPTVVMLLILTIGQLFSDNFELIYGLSNPFIDFEVISTLVYKRGITQGEYSVATALGFIQGVAGFLLMIIANTISKKVNDVGIW